MQSTNLPWIVEVAGLEDIVQMHSTILEKIVKTHPVLCGGDRTSSLHPSDTESRTVETPLRQRSCVVIRLIQEGHALDGSVHRDLFQRVDLLSNGPRHP